MRALGEQVEQRDYGQKTAEDGKNGLEKQDFVIGKDGKRRKKRKSIAKRLRVSVTKAALAVKRTAIALMPVEKDEEIELADHVLQEGHISRLPYHRARPPSSRSRFELTDHHHLPQEIANRELAHGVVMFKSTQAAMVIQTYARRWVAKRRMADELGILTQILRMQYYIRRNDILPH